MASQSFNSFKAISAVNESKFGCSKMRLRHEANGTLDARVNGSTGTRKVSQSIQSEVSEMNSKKKCQGVSIFQLVLDKANLCTFSGTILTTLALANIWKRRYFLGLTISTLASLADILDGPIARSSHNRKQPVCTVGKYLDMYSDVISHFVIPASLLMEVSDLNPVCVLLAALFVCAGVLRHARHEIIERLDGDSCAYGVTSDYLVSTFAITGHLVAVVDIQTVAIVLSIVTAISIFVSLGKVFRSRRYSGVDLFVVGIFHVWLALSCTVLRCFLLAKKDGSFWTLEEDYNNGDESGFWGFTISQVATGLLAMNLALAYPCYYRFIERNV